LIVFFALLGSLSVKAGHKMLVKSTPGIHFTNVLQAAFAPKDTKVQKDTDDLTVFLHLWDLHA